MHGLLMRGMLVVVVAAALGAGVAGASPAGTNGQITFARFNAALGDTQIYTVDPDGSHARLIQAPTDTGECPRWFSDGAHIAACGSPVGESRIYDVDGGTFRDVGTQDPALFNPCGLPSPDGKLLLCETFGLTDDSVNGIHTVRTSDGGGFTAVTSNPGGDDVPSDWSPNGRSIVFQRFGANGYEGVFVVNVNGTGLRRILPPSIAGGGPRWSPQGNDLVFSRHATPDAHSSLWIVHSDGSDLHQVNVQPASACGGLNADPTADGCVSPAFSPDGTKIVFARGQNVDVDGEIYTVNLDGTDLRQVTNLPGSQGPDWGTHPLAQ